MAARCPYTAPELRGTLNWSGRMLLKARVWTRAGVVEVADFEVVSRRPEPRAGDYFRSVVLRALVGYQCEGDHVFEQEFEFAVE